MKTTVIDSMDLAHHLGIVAEHYEENAAQFRKLLDEKVTAASTRASDVEARRLAAAAEADGRLAEQFDRQAKQCRDWCEALYNQDSIRADGDRILVKSAETEAA